MPPETLRDLEASHQVSELLRKGVSAEQKLLSGEKYSAEETRELLTDTMMLEYVNGGLMADYKAADKVANGPGAQKAQAALKNIQKQCDDEIKRLIKEKKETSDPQEVTRLETEIQLAEQKQSHDVTREAGLLQKRIGTIRFNEPSSDKFRAFGDPAQLKQMRENVMNSRVVSSLLRMAPGNRAAELGQLLGKVDSAEYNRLYMDLAGTVDGIVPAAPAPVMGGGAAAGVSGRVQEKQHEQKNVAVPGGPH